MTGRAITSVLAVAAVAVASLATAGSPAEAGTIPTPPTFVAQWGSEGAADDQFKQPWGVVVNRAGEVFVADRDNMRIKRFSPNGTLIDAWGGVGNGPGQFANPYGMAADSADNLYVADTSNNRVQKFAPDGRFLAQWGGWGYWEGQFRYPQGVAIDSNDNVYVADGEGSRIQKFTADGQFLDQWGELGSEEGSFSYPRDVAVDGMDNIYVADSRNHRIQVFEADGTFLRAWGSEGEGDGQFREPFALFVDGGGDVYVADYLNHRVQQFDSSGTYLTEWGGEGSGPGQFTNPQGVTVDPGGGVYVADGFNHRVQRFAPEGSAVIAGLRATPDVVPVGDDVAYEVRISNGGTTPLTGVALTDAPAPDCGGSLPDIPVGGEHVVTCSYTATAADVGTLTNAATVDTDQTGSADSNVEHITVVAATAIGGTVTGTGSGDPVGGAWVALLSAADLSLAGSTVADRGGRFHAPVAPGSYFAYVVDPGRRHLSGFHGAPSAITVMAGETSAASTMLAPTTGSITGVIRQAGSATPISEAWALALDAGSGAVVGMDVASLWLGEYSIEGLPPGDYRVIFLDPAGGHDPRYFPASPDPGGASPVAVASGAASVADGMLPVSAAEGSLPTNAGGDHSGGPHALWGTVTEAGSGDPLAGMLVVALRAGDFSLAEATTTSQGGNYEFTITSGEHYVVFLDPTGAHAGTWHDGQPLTGLADATAVLAPATVNAAMVPTVGAFSGTVTDEASGEPIEGTTVLALGPDGITGATTTGPSGTYMMAGLEPGSFGVVFVDETAERALEYFDDSPDLAGSIQVTITAGATTMGVDAALAP